MSYLNVNSPTFLNELTLTGLADEEYIPFLGS